MAKGQRIARILLTGNGGHMKRLARRRLSQPSTSTARATGEGHGPARLTVPKGARADMVELSLRPASKLASEQEEGLDARG